MSVLKDRIILIVGKSGTGKTTLTDGLVEISKKHGQKLEVLQSYTTRPPRYKGETGHVFVTNQEFDKLENICGFTYFDGNRYCATSQQVDENDIYVIDPKGVDFFIHAYRGKKKIIVYELKVPFGKRFMRMWHSRSDKFIKAVKRIIHDSLNYVDLNGAYLWTNHIEHRVINGEMSPRLMAKKVYDDLMRDSKKSYIEEKCHKRNERNTISIGVDLDDVLWELLEPWVNEYNKSSGDNLQLTDILSWNVEKYIGENHTADELFDVLKNPSFWNNVYPKQGSISYLKKLIYEGYNISIVTASHPLTLTAKMKRLFELFPFINPEQVMIIHNKKLLQLDVLLDDKLDNLLNAKYQGVLMSTVHNKRHKNCAFDKDNPKNNNIKIVNTWKEFYEYIHNTYPIKTFTEV